MNRREKITSLTQLHRSVPPVSEIQSDPHSCSRCKFYTKQGTCQLRQQVIRKHGQKNLQTWLMNSRKRNKCSFYEPAFGSQFFSTAPVSVTSRGHIRNPMKEIHAGSAFIQTPDEANYRFITFESPKVAIFLNKSTKIEERFVRRKTPVVGWQLKYRNYYWEFISSLFDEDVYPTSSNPQFDDDFYDERGRDKYLYLGMSERMPIHYRKAKEFFQRGDTYNALQHAMTYISLSHSGYGTLEKRKEMEDLRDRIRAERVSGAHLNSRIGKYNLHRRSDYHRKQNVGDIHIDIESHRGSSEENPSRGSRIRKAINAHTKFNFKEPKGVKKFNLPIEEGDSFFYIGGVPQINYLSSKEGKKTEYYHKFHSSCVMYADSNKKCLIIMRKDGKPFQITDWFYK